MYVAATRAAFWLGCSGYWWGEGGSSRLGPSPFLAEVRKSGVAQVPVWAPAPEPDAENPLLAAVDAADWPATPAGRHYEAVREAAALVRTAMEEPGPTEPGPLDPGHPGLADLLEERRGSQAAAAALAPPVAGTAQPERRPGGRHVHQPALLG